jgi:hypothetical protein
MALVEEAAPKDPRNLLGLQTYTLMRAGWSLIVPI